MSGPGLAPTWDRHPGPRRGTAKAGAATSSPRSLTLRALRLHLASRSAPAALAALAVCAGGLRVALWWHGDRGSIQVPLIVEAAAAAIVSVATANPFGEAEQTAGSRLSRLRLLAATSLMAAAVVALTAGAAGEPLPGGAGALVRDTAGMAGVGLLAAGLVGGAFSWLGPMAYLALAEVALSSDWHTPWTWPARPPGDAGGALCAALLLAAGLVAAASRGPRAMAVPGAIWAPRSPLTGGWPSRVVSGAHGRRRRDGRAGN